MAEQMLHQMSDDTTYTKWGSQAPNLPSNQTKKPNSSKRKKPPAKAINLEKSSKLSSMNETGTQSSTCSPSTQLQNDSEQQQPTKTTISCTQPAYLITDPLSYTMEVFDILILPNMQWSQSTTAPDLIRKWLYRKFLAKIAQNQLTSNYLDINSIENLLPQRFSIAQKAGLLIV